MSNSDRGFDRRGSGEEAAGHDDSFLWELLPSLAFEREEVGTTTMNPLQLWRILDKPPSVSGGDDCCA